MKAFITLCDKGGGYDPPLTPLFRSLEKTSLQECDVVVMPITYLPEYVADDELMDAISSSGKKIIIFDFVEYGWDRKIDHIFGMGINHSKHKEFEKLENFIAKNINNIALYFKRELYEVSEFKPPFKVIPIEYPGVNSLTTFTRPATFEEYNERPIDIIMTWGMSNPSRPILHGELCKKSGTNGQSLVTNLDHIAEYQKRGTKNMAVIIMTPDFARESIYKFLHIQSLAKISISLNGAGCKCFRHAESSYNTVMALQENNLQWSYPWVNGINSIELPNKPDSPLIDEDRSYLRLMDNLKNPEKLYIMYLQGINNWKNYDIENYTNDYILKEITNAV